jgi:predicted Fe-S protein YdhL (DUF1289 family)
MTAPQLDPRRSATGEVPSPCDSVCAIDPDSGYCIGCFRTLDEIAGWIGLDAAARLAVWDAIDERKKAADANR